VTQKLEDGGWTVAYDCLTLDGGSLKNLTADIKADCRAKMLIYLLENGLYRV
jgi:hypothetical protein